MPAKSKEPVYKPPEILDVSSLQPKILALLDTLPADPKVGYMGGINLFSDTPNFDTNTNADSKELRAEVQKLAKCFDSDTEKEILDEFYKTFDIENQRTFLRKFQNNLSKAAKMCTTTSTASSSSIPDSTTPHKQEPTSTKGILKDTSKRSSNADDTTTPSRDSVKFGRARTRTFEAKDFESSSDEETPGFTSRALERTARKKHKPTGKRQKSKDRKSFPSSDTATSYTSSSSATSPIGQDLAISEARLSAALGNILKTVEHNLAWSIIPKDNPVNSPFTRMSELFLTYKLPPSEESVKKLSYIPLFSSVKVCAESFRDPFRKDILAAFLKLETDSERQAFVLTLNKNMHASLKDYEDRYDRLKKAEKAAYNKAKDEKRENPTKNLTDLYNKALIETSRRYERDAQNKALEKTSGSPEPRARTESDATLSSSSTARFPEWKAVDDWDRSSPSSSSPSFSGRSRSSTTTSSDLVYPPSLMTGKLTAAISGMFRFPSTPGTPLWQAEESAIKAMQEVDLFSNEPFQNIRALDERERVEKMSRCFDAKVRKDIMSSYAACADKSSVEASRFVRILEANLKEAAEMLRKHNNIPQPLRNNAAAAKATSSTTPPIAENKAISKETLAAELDRMLQAAEQNLSWANTEVNGKSPFNRMYQLTRIDFRISLTSVNNETDMGLNRRVHDLTNSFDATFAERIKTAFRTLTDEQDKKKFVVALHNNLYDSSQAFAPHYFKVVNIESIARKEAVQLQRDPNVPADIAKREAIAKAERTLAEQRTQTAQNQALAQAQAGLTSARVTPQSLPDSARTSVFARPGTVRPGAGPGITLKTGTLSADAGLEPQESIEDPDFKRDCQAIVAKYRKLVEPARVTTHTEKKAMHILEPARWEIRLAANGNKDVTIPNDNAAAMKIIQAVIEGLPPGSPVHIALTDLGQIQVAESLARARHLKVTKSPQAEKILAEAPASPEPPALRPGAAGVGAGTARPESGAAPRPATKSAAKPGTTSSGSDSSDSSDSDEELDNHSRSRPGKRNR